MVRLDWASGRLESNAEVRESVKTLGQLEGIFANADALRGMDPNTVVYRVQAWCPIPEGTEGALFWGNTVIEPGKVDSEYFMTHGHFHLKRNRTEYYATVEGEGALIQSPAPQIEPVAAGVEARDGKSADEPTEAVKEERKSRAAQPSAAPAATPQARKKPHH